MKRRGSGDCANTITAARVHQISPDPGLAGPRIVGFGFASVGTMEAVAASREGKDYLQRQCPSSLVSW